MPFSLNLTALASRRTLTPGRAARERIEKGNGRAAIQRELPRGRPPPQSPQTPGADAAGRDGDSVDGGLSGTASRLCPRPESLPLAFSQELFVVAPMENVKLPFLRSPVDAGRTDCRTDSDKNFSPLLPTWISGADALANAANRHQPDRLDTHTKGTGGPRLT